MPFDGTILNTRPKIVPGSLSEVLQELNIQPVPKELLEQHKQAEIARHPASLVVRNPLLHGVSVMAILLAMSVSVTWLLGSGDLFPLILSALATAGFIYLTMLLHRDHARWREKLYYGPEHLTMTMPLPIRQLAWKLSDSTSHLRPAEFIVGTLIQDRVVLDPYLLMRVDFETDWVCLGIWDGKRVLHIAQ